MSVPTPTNESAEAMVAEVVEPRPAHGSRLGPLSALFWLSLRQNCRGKRLIFLMCVFALPAILAIVVRLFADNTNLRDMEGGFVYGIITGALMPLAALLYACGMIGDEIEDQTLTYLLVRPLPKSILYLVKLAATVVVAVLLTAVFTVLTYLALYVGDAAFWNDHILLIAGQTVGLFALALLAYCAIFGFLSLLLRQALMLGIVYILLVEGLMGNIDFVARRLTVTYYLKVLEERWLNRFPKMFDFNMADVPTAAGCVEVLIISSVVLTGISMFMMANREFRMKTPHGS
jgi:ABC-2 type transport system permease protein